MYLTVFNFLKYFVFALICGKDLDKYYSFKSWVFRKLSRLGFYEREQLKFIKRHVRAGGIAIDGGANFGIYTDVLSEAVGEKGKVIAIEPLTSISSYLDSRFSVQKNVFVYQKALSNSSGNSVKIHIPFIHKDLPEPALASLVKPSIEHSTNLVTTITLDDLAESHGKISFVKLELEGYELEALRGGIACLLRDRPVVQFEVNDMALKHTEYLEFAEQVNYSIMELIGSELCNFDPTKSSNTYNFYLVPKG